MTKQEWYKNHIVTIDDINTPSSPVCLVLDSLDDCSAYLRKIANRVQELKHEAIIAVTDYREKLTAEEWNVKYIDPIEDMFFNIEYGMRTLVESRSAETEVKYEDE